MSKTDDQQYRAGIQRFVDLANSMKDEGIDTRVVLEGLMTASAVYATYTFAGNDGRLAPAGITRVVDAYRKRLEQVQQAKEESKAAPGQAGAGKTAG